MMKFRVMTYHVRYPEDRFYSSDEWLLGLYDDLDEAVKAAASSVRACDVRYACGGRPVSSIPSPASFESGRACVFCNGAYVDRVDVDESGELPDESCCVDPPVLYRCQFYDSYDAVLEAARAEYADDLDDDGPGPLFAADPAEAAALAAYEAERARPTQNAEGVHVGDIYYASWGWEQTNVDYFQVVALQGAHTVALRPVRARCVDDPRAMTGLCRPLRDAFETDALPLLVRSSTDEKGALRMCAPIGDSRCFLHLTTWGVAERYSTYA